MSECVVRMEMPKRCAECPLSCQMYGDTPCYCKVAFEENEAVEGGLMWKETDPTKRPSWCPIICSLPEGHGRLVDADDLERYWLSRIALMDSCAGKGGILESVERSTLRSCIEDIGNSKTIVPAEAERSET